MGLFRNPKRIFVTGLIVVLPVFVTCWLLKILFDLLDGPVAALIEAHLNILAPAHYAHDTQLAYWRALAGLCALRAGKRQRATQLFELSRAAFVEQPNVSPYYKAPQIQLAAKLGKPAAAAR